METDEPKKTIPANTRALKKQALECQKSAKIFHEDFLSIIFEEYLLVN